MSTVATWFRAAHFTAGRVRNAVGAALWLALVSTPQQPTRVNGGFPVVSPDGKHIAYWGDRGDGPQIFVARGDGSQELQLTRGSQDHGRPTWFADGKQVVYFESVNDTGPSRIFQVNVDGSGRRPIGTVSGRNPQLMRDGRVLFVSGGWNGAKLAIAQLDGSRERRISDGTGSTYNPAVAPDGRQVA